MKRVLLGAALALVMTAGFESKAAGIADKLLLYVPYRIVDTVDIVSISLGMGPTAKLEGRATRAFDLGAGVGPTIKVIKGYNRQYGLAKENGWNTAFTCISAEDYTRTGNIGYAQEFIYQETGMPLPSEKIYNVDKGARDYYGIGASAALLIAADVEVHPVDIADLVTGFFFYDLKGDDFTLEDAKK